MPQINFTTPVGRLVQGSLYTPNDKDADGNLRVYKTGPNTGKPRPEFYVALAIPKIAGQHWASSDWGSKIWQAGHAFLGHAGQLPAFAWKVRDGDSTVPNKKNKKPCEQEGFPGNWVVSFSSGFAPRCYTLVNQPAKEPLALDQKDAINLGDYVQINANVDGNDSAQQPGVFVNLGMVCLVGYGQRIVLGPDVASAGFGAAPLPAGASQTPPATFAPPAIPGTPAVPSTALPAVPTAPIPALPATAPSSIVSPLPLPPATPNPAFLQPTPAAPPVPTAPVRAMLPAAGGIPYEQYIGRGWTDALLIQHGMMAA